MIYLQGRLFATSEADAVDKLYTLLAVQGYAVAGEPWLKAANVQFCGECWVEFHVEIQEIE